MEFLVTGLILLSFITYNRIKRVLELDTEVDELKEQLMISEDVLTRKNRENTNLKRQVQDMYKTIDEYTSEKSGLECDAEVTEKALKPKRKK